MVLGRWSALAAAIAALFASPAPPHAHVLGRSVERRPIDAYEIGDPSARRKVLVYTLRIGILVSRQHEDISSRLLRGALEALRARSLPDPPDVTWVPGDTAYTMEVFGHED